MVVRLLLRHSQSVVLLLLLSLLLQTTYHGADGVAVELNTALARSYDDADSVPLQFSADASEPLAANLLVTLSGSYGDPHDRIPCVESDTKRERGANVTVLLAVSKCLDASALRRIESWVATIEDQKLTFFQDGVESPIVFATTVVSGDCVKETTRVQDARSTTAPTSTANARVLATANVVESDLARIASFKRFGRVLNALPTAPASSTTSKITTMTPTNTVDGIESVRPIAVVSFVNDAQSFDEVEQFERSFRIRRAFNFHLCDARRRNSSSSSGHNNSQQHTGGNDWACDNDDPPLLNAIPLQTTADLTLYNLFRVTHTTTCPGLEHGIPVTYVDSVNKRQCFCACPADMQQRRTNDDDSGDRSDSGSSSSKTPVCEPTPCPTEPSCAWNAHPYGFKHEVTTKLRSCTLHRIATDWHIPVPFPTDNYVADKRTNSYGRNANDPSVTLTSTKLPTQTYDGARLRSLSTLSDAGLFERHAPPPGVIDLLDLLAMGDVTTYLLDVEPQPAHVVMRADAEDDAHVYAWSDYQKRRVAAVDALTVTAYGKYALTLFAKDYAHNATCTGCVAVVDKFRPRATTTCPVRLAATATVAAGSLSDAHPNAAEFTIANAASADALVQSFFAFSDKAENDACSDARCDATAWRTRSFFDATYVDVTTTATAATVKRTFDRDSVKGDFAAALARRKNPLAKASDPTCSVQEAVPIVAGLCARCAKLSTALREFWTDYTCNYEYDVQQCDGDATQTCALEQCLVATGRSLATATLAPHPAVAKRATDLGAKAATEIRRDVGSGCSKIGASSSACRVTAKLSDWLVASVSANVASVLGADSTKYVFWRYRIGGSSTGEWKLWGANAGTAEVQETFTAADTKVTFEAWTPCGVVTPALTFSVVLVLPKAGYGYSAAALAVLSDAVASVVTAGHESVAGTVVATALAACALVTLMVVVVLRRRSSAANSAANVTRLDMEDSAYRPLLEE